MLKSVAEKVAQHTVSLGDNREAALDPSKILVIMEVITNLIEMYQNCNKSASEAHKRMEHPTFADKVVARFTVRKALGGYREFKNNDGQRLVDAILATGKNLSVEEVRGLYDEI